MASINRNVMDNSKLAQLFQQTHDEALQRNEESHRNWRKNKEDHLILRSQLETLPYKLSHDVMVPIGSRALMKGKIVHTNEIFVCLGASWFAKQSAKCATEICDRRITLCNDMLTNLDTEKELLSSRKQLPFDQEVFSDEITELYDEEVEAKWRVRHREKERQYRQELRKSRTEENVSNTDEELWNRLEQLELQEELQQELDKFHDEESQHGNSLEHEPSLIQESTVPSDLSSILLKEHAPKRRVSFGDEKSFSETNYGGGTSSEVQPATIPETTASSISNKLLEEHIPKRRVSFVDEKSFTETNNTEDGDSDSSDEPLCIQFRHSSLLGQSQRPPNDSYNQILTPADIYNIVPRITPKSILKQHSHHSSALVVNETVDSDSSVKKVDYPMLSKNIMDETSVPLAFGDVVERVTKDVTHNLEEVQSVHERPVSRFRANRQTTK